MAKTKEESTAKTRVVGAATIPGKAGIIANALVLYLSKLKATNEGSAILVEAYKAAGGTSKGARTIMGKRKDKTGKEVKVEVKVDESYDAHRHFYSKVFNNTKAAIAKMDEKTLNTLASAYKAAYNDFDAPGKPTQKASHLAMLKAIASAAGTTGKKGGHGRNAGNITLPALTF